MKPAWPVTAYVALIVGFWVIVAAWPPDGGAKGSVAGLLVIGLLLLGLLRGSFIAWVLLMAGHVFVLSFALHGLTSGGTWYPPGVVVAVVGLVLLLLVRRQRGAPRWARRGETGLFRFD